MVLHLVYFASFIQNILGRREENTRTNLGATSKKCTHHNRNLIKNFWEEFIMPAAFQAVQYHLHIKLCIDTVCLDMALGSVVDTYHYFGGTCCVHLKGALKLILLTPSWLSVASVSKFLRYLGYHVPNNRVSHFRISKPWYSPPWQPQISQNILTYWIILAGLFFLSFLFFVGVWNLVCDCIGV